MCNRAIFGLCINHRRLPEFRAIPLDIDKYILNWIKYQRTINSPLQRTNLCLRDKLQSDSIVM
ncbi:MAG: hypothetical protein ACI8XB_001428 [Patiriisocius sp.]|jgi:hypothetical protein